MLVGGFVAVLVQALFFPVTGRQKLVESLGQAVLNINEMESAIAIGLESEGVDLSSVKLAKNFKRSRKRASLYLAAATNYCSCLIVYTHIDEKLIYADIMTRREPSLKRSSEYMSTFTQVGCAFTLP